MENDMNNLEELLVLYALGELEPDEASAVEEQLQKRPDLAAQVEKVRRADGLLSNVFALSDEAVQASSAEESVKPKIADKTVKSQGRLARRFAFTAAALALIVVVGALVYPEFVSKDVQVAMSPEEETIKSSGTENSVSNELAAETESPSEKIEKAEEAKQMPNRFTLVAKDPVPEDAADEMDITEGDALALEPADMGDYSIDDELSFAPEPEDSTSDMEDNSIAGEKSFAPAPAAPTADMDNDAPGVRKSPSKNKALPLIAKEPEAEEVPAEYSIKNALYDIPGQKTADGMAPIKGETPPMNEQLLPDEYLAEMAVNQMNKQLGAPRRSTSQPTPAPAKYVDQRKKKGIEYDEAVPVPGSYVVLQKTVMEGNRLPNPESVNVEQWLNYFGVAQPVKAKEQEIKREEIANKDAQFAKAVNQFAAALSSSEPVDVKAFEEVLDLLKDSVGDDAKRLEFKAIVEKTIEIKKKISE